MSKKKPNPMTLKDFHGGTIPSDLPLPSAPGVMVRPADRGGFDRQMSWGNSMGRPDHRLRPASAGSARTIDDRTPFLSHTSHIGRNFDEDERKPLDGISGPRRTVVDETIHPHSSRSVATKIISSGSNTPAAMAGEVHKMGVNLQNYSGGRGYSSNYPNMGPGAGQPVSGSYPNAWGLRKEAVSIKESASAAWSAPAAATKLAHASALEQISSGRWNSKLSIPTSKDANSKNNYDRLDVEGESDYNDVSLVMHAERSVSVDDGNRGGGKNIISGVSEKRNPSINNVSQSPYPARKSGGTEYPPAVLPDLSERPKLKLIPRTKPMEKLEQDYQLPSDHLQTGGSYGIQEPATPAESGMNGPLTSDHAVERPKLNLKPRSQPLEHFEGNSGMGKGAVFGGARPRELVLKERGIDDSLSNYESPSPVRAKEDTPKVDASLHIPPARTDRRDQQLDGERYRRSEIRRDQRDVEKRRIQQQQQQLKERPPSPESWRKPVEQPNKPMDNSLRYGKAASAVELAQAFSKSVSDTTKQPDRFSGRTQIPFSRLTGPTPRAQLNGY